MNKVTYFRAKPRVAQILDGTVFLALSALVVYTVSRHEPWADEADTWLEVRDLRLFHILFKELRYDGHLPLWHSTVWIGMHILHLPYARFGYLGAAIALAGLAVLLFLAPFPRPLRYAIAASFFPLYQYAAVARPYVFVPLLAFLSAHFYRQSLPRIVPFAVAAALLIQDSSYAAVMGVTFAFFYGLQLLQKWQELPGSDRKKVMLAGSLVLLSTVFAVVVLFPPADSSLMVSAVEKTFRRHLELYSEGLVGAFADTALVAIPFLVLAAIWAYQRGVLLLLVASVGGTAFVYGFVQGFGHHQGIMTISMVMVAWAGWPSAKEAKYRGPAHTVQLSFVTAMTILFAWQCTWSYAAIRNDWAGPYSGAKDAAAYLKSVHADELGCSGYKFWAVAVQPYFGRNLFLNYGGQTAPARYHFSIDFERRANLATDWEMQNGPPFIVVAPPGMSLEQAQPIIRELSSWNYVLVHSSDGGLFFKNRSDHSLYLIFEKIDFALSRPGR